jgi:hypothetical protein
MDGRLVARVNTQTSWNLADCVTWFQPVPASEPASGRQ